MQWNITFAQIFCERLINFAWKNYLDQLAGCNCLGENYLKGNCPGRNYSWDNYPVAICPGANFPWGNCLGGNCPGGNCPRTHLWNHCFYTGHLAICVFSLYKHKKSIVLKNSLLTHISKRKHAFREYLSFILKTYFIKKCSKMTKHNKKRMDKKI